MMTRENEVQQQRSLLQAIKYVLLESDRSIINWSNFNKGILLLIFGLLMLIGHWLWYYLTFHSEYQIWLDPEYYPHRTLTTCLQVILTTCFLTIALVLRKNATARRILGYLIPLFYGLIVIFSGYTVGIYSPAVMAGTVNIVLIGFVLYEQRIIYSVSFIIACIIVWLAVLTANGQLTYAPLFSDALNQSNLYANPFWLKSMAVLYLPILLCSAVFFELILSQWRRRERKIEILSQKDALTNLYNRRYINQFISKLIQQNRSFAFILLDLDFFKQINDNYGHDVGDLVLKRIALILKQQTREEDIVGRLGGEEFVLVLKDGDIDEALIIAERCRRTIESEKIEISPATFIQVTASFGVAMSQNLPHLYTDEVKQRIYSAADKALYLAKQNGRNQVRCDTISTAEFNI